MDEKRIPRVRFECLHLAWISKYMPKEAKKVGTNWNWFSNTCTYLSNISDWAIVEGRRDKTDSRLFMYIRSRHRTFHYDWCSSCNQKIMKYWPIQQWHWLVMIPWEMYLKCTSISCLEIFEQNKRMVLPPSAGAQFSLILRMDRSRYTFLSRITALTMGLTWRRCWLLGNTWKHNLSELRLMEVTLFLWSKPFWNGSTPFFSRWASELGMSLRLTHCTPMLGKVAVIVSSFISVMQIPLMHFFPTKLWGWALWGSFSSTHETMTRVGPLDLSV